MQIFREQCSEKSIEFEFKAYRKRKKIVVRGCLGLRINCTQKSANKAMQSDSVRGVCIVVSLSLNFTTMQTPHTLRLMAALGEKERREKQKHKYLLLYCVSVNPKVHIDRGETESMGVKLAKKYSRKILKYSMEFLA